jgi:hypothetical protein
MCLTSNNSWSQCRDIPSSLWPTPGFCGAMSMAGTATMLMLELEAGYAAEVVMFGGYRRGRGEFACPACTCWRLCDFGVHHGGAMRNVSMSCDRTCCIVHQDKRCRSV